MPKWLEAVLGGLYMKVPREMRPYLKNIFLWILIRIQALSRRRKLYQGDRIQFVDFEIAHLEKYEFLGPGPGEVTVKSSASTISPGTEAAVLCGLPGARRMFPYTPGYSTMGHIISVGKNATRFKVGDRVVGRISHVSAATVSENVLFKVPDDVTDEEASFLELGIIVLQGIRKSAIQPGDRVAVLGQGLIGQLSNRLLRLVGASEIIAVAATRNREATALRPGGAHRYVALKEHTSARSDIQADVVIEAVGTPQAIVTALECVRPGGKVILLGSSRGLSRDVDLRGLLQENDVTVIGAHISGMPEYDASKGRWTYRQEGTLFLDLLATGRLRVADLVTWRAKPSECNAVYEQLAAGGRNQVGIVFQWA